MQQHSLENAKLGLYNKSVTHCKQTLLHLMPKYTTRISLKTHLIRCQLGNVHPKNQQQIQKFSRMSENLNYNHSKSFRYTKYITASFLLLK